MPPVLVGLALLHPVPVAQEHGARPPVGLDPHPVEDRHVVRPVGVERDPSKSHRLALCAVQLHSIELIGSLMLGLFDAYSASRMRELWLSLDRSK